MKWGSWRWRFTGATSVADKRNGLPVAFSRVISEKSIAGEKQNITDRILKLLGGHAQINSMTRRVVKRAAGIARVLHRQALNSDFQRPYDLHRGVHENRVNLLTSGVTARKLFVVNILGRAGFPGPPLAKGWPGLVFGFQRGFNVQDDPALIVLEINVVGTVFPAVDGNYHRAFPQGLIPD